MILGAVNWLAIIVAAVASMALGFGWYMLLGRQWMAALGPRRAEPDGDQLRPFAIAAAMQLVMAYFLALLTPRVMGATTFGDGLAMGFWLWLGFVATSMVINHRFQGASWRLTLIDGGYFLAVLLVQGALIGLFG